MTGELLTRLTIWAAMVAWTLGILTRNRVSRLAWTAGFLVYLVHIVLAFEVFYSWSQTVAQEETARQTYQLTGWNSGVGLWVNYAFTAFLAYDLANQWRGRAGHLHKTRNALVLFMILNGAIIFGSTPSRLLGIVLLGAVALVRVHRVKKASSNTK